MDSKKWTLTLLSLTLAIVILFGTLTYCLDPLLQYGADRGLLTYRHYSEIYCNPGIARNYSYNAVFLGSSMVENANVSELDSLLECKTVKLPYSGASSYNHKHILDVCYQSGNKIDKVFWALDEYAFTTDKDTPRYPLPEYLYDQNRINDLSYLLNLDVFYFYTLKGMIGTLQNRSEILMKDGSWSTDESAYNRANALAAVSYPLPTQTSKGKDYYAKTLTENLTYNVLPFIEAHPETEFYFYMVPYSISYWYMCRQGGKLEAEINIIQTLAETLLKYDNVRLFFFQDEQDIITNLDNYRDHTHFKPSVNSYMSNQIANGQNELHITDYKQRIESFYQYLSEFEYDVFYLEQYDLIRAG
jgi:hypothetical protein